MKGLDIERAVLGACLLESSAFPQVSDLLTEADFTDDFRIRVWRAMAELHISHQPIDMLTVSRKVRDIPDAVFRLTEITGSVASSANLEYHAFLLVQDTIQREMSAIYASALARNEKDPAGAISYVEQEMSRHIARMSRKKAEEIRAVLDRTEHDVYERVKAARAGMAPGITTGIPKVDMETGGVMLTDYVIVAGRPGMGKSLIMVSLAKGMALAGTKVGILSLEMTSGQIAERLASSDCMIPYSDIRRGRMNDVELGTFGDAVMRAKKLPILIDDESGLSTMKYRAKVQRMAEAGCKVVFVDYIQLIGGDDERDERIRVKRVSKMTKEMCKEFDIAIVALAQLSRDAENNPDKRPLLRNLAESSQLEMDADTVWLLWRPEYYGISGYEVNGADMDTAGKLWLIQEKHRFGPKGFDYVLDCDVATNRIGGSRDYFGQIQAPMDPFDNPF